VRHATASEKNVMSYRIVIGMLGLLLFCSVESLLAEDAELPPNEGIDRYENLVQQYPQKASYHNALGYYYLKAENYEKAEACFLLALELDCAHATAHNNLGIVYLHRGLPEKAEKEFRQAIKLNPGYCKAQYNLAVALFHQKRYSKAAKAYLKALEMDRAYVERRDNPEKIQEKMKQTFRQAGDDDSSAGSLKRLKQWFAPHY
jgi:tetratricopeptide (TPR) repeat protein